jgi:DTW domain-containing protein
VKNSLITNQFHRLRAICKAASTTQFLARGKSVVRCEMCQLAEFACLCDWVPKIKSRCEFILIMHRFEVFKPTNTGRLIADVLPNNTHVFSWSRTEPAPELLKLLNDKNRQCFIVFPASTETESKKPRAIFSEIPESKLTPTFILLDGTWKQSGRMFHLSCWLEGVACISFSEAILGDYMRGYAMRKSHQDNFLSTAEAAALCLRMASEVGNSETLLNYFQLFNEHYMATRGCYAPVVGELHQKLARNK